MLLGPTEKEPKLRLNELVRISFSQRVCWPMLMLSGAFLPACLKSILAMEGGWFVTYTRYGNHWKKEKKQTCCPGT